MANTPRTPDQVQIATGQIATVQIATGQIDPAVIRTAIDQARQSARQIGDLQAVNGRTIRTLETALNQSIKGALNTPLNDRQIAQDLRFAHRRGTLSPIISNPELQAFIRARIGTMSYGAIAAAVAAAFPPGQHTSVSALSRWWSKQRGAYAP